MTIEVEGPDGIIYEFPDGTDEATMRAAMAKVYPKIDTEWSGVSPFDPAKNKPRDNGDGSFSTEITITNDAPDGGFWNIPTLWWTADGQPRELSPEAAQALAKRYEEATGKKFPRFNSVLEAEATAKGRSAGGGATYGALTDTYGQPAGGLPADNSAIFAQIEARGTPVLPVQGEAMPPVDTSAIVPPGSSNDPIAKGINDISGAFGAGLARGSASLVGLPGTAVDIQTGSLAWLANKLLGTDLNAPKIGTSGEALQGLLGEVTGGATEFKGDSTAAQYAGTVGEFLPGTAAFGGLSPANLLRYGVVPGLASEAAGQATKDTALEPWARMVSALAAPLAVGALGKVVSPLGGADPERLKLAKVLDDFGVPVTAGQRTGSEAMRKVEAGTIGAGGVAEKQAEAFTAAALKTAGIDAKRATPEVLDDAFVRLGNTFDDIVRGVDITPDSAAVTKMSEALSTYRQLAPKASAPPIFENINKAMVQAFRTGNPIPAATLKVWRTNLSKLTTSADTATREVAQAAMSVVDDAISSGLVAAGKPEAVAKLAEARGQYRNLLALMTAASRAGETARAGILSPGAVARAVTLQGRKAFATGNRGDVGALASAGEGVMAPLPTVMPGGVRAIEGLSSLGLGAAGLNTFGPYGLLAAAIPRATKELLGAPGVQNWLGNQAVNIPMGIPQVRATIPGLLAQ